MILVVKEPASWKGPREKFPSQDSPTTPTFLALESCGFSVYPNRIYGIGIFTLPWMVDFDGIHVGKYTNPTDPMGYWLNTLPSKKLPGLPWHVPGTQVMQRPLVVQKHRPWSKAERNPRSHLLFANYERNPQKWPVGRASGVCSSSVFFFNNLRWSFPSTLHTKINNSHSCL